MVEHSLGDECAGPTTYQREDMQRAFWRPPSAALCCCFISAIGGKRGCACSQVQNENRQRSRIYHSAPETIPLPHRYTWMRDHRVATSPADLFERHHVAIYRYLLRMIGSRDAAEELTQEVFVRVLKGLESYEERDKERAWLFRIARNLRCDRTRQLHRQQTPMPLEEIHLVEPQQQELRLSLIRVLATLKDDDREAFVLAEIAGFSYEEIAAICETSGAAIRSRIYRARMALRLALESPAARERYYVKGTHV